MICISVTFLSLSLSLILFCSYFLQRSENSGSEDSSQNDSRSASRSSTHSSSDLYDTLRMSTLFVHSVVPGGPAEQAGLQTGTYMYIVS